MNTPTIEKAKGVRIVRNNSKMSDNQIIHKVADSRWEPGHHQILVQNRYGDGEFFVDWGKLPDPEKFNERDWNVIVEVMK